MRCHYSARWDHDILSNLHSAQNDRTGTNGHSIAYLYRTFIESDLLRMTNGEDTSDLGMSLCGAKRMGVIVEDVHIWADHDVIANLDRTAGPYPRTDIDVAVSSDFDIATVCKNEQFAGHKGILANTDVFAALACVEYSGPPAELRALREQAGRATKQRLHQII